MSDLPSRPRLGEHVLARRHFADGEERVVLHDLRTGGLVQIGPREWGLIACADGTRDLEGIVLAAAREGAHARVDALRGFFEQLAQAGLLAGEAAPDASGARGAPSPREPEARVSPRDRPLVALPSFSLHCDGSGSCCRIYASILFGPVEAARARALLPLVLDAGERHERAFLPEHGSAPTGGSAVALRDGRCAYLADSGRCSLHAAAGPAAKPIGCNAFPATFIDDGEVVRVSASVECACVLASAGRDGGAPILDPAARVRGDLDLAIVVDTLPAEIAITGEITAPRAEAVAWSRRVAGLPAFADAAAALFHLGDAIDRAGLSADLAPFSAPLPRLDAPSLLPWIAALHRRASRRERDDAAWRGARDLARLATRWIAAASASLLDPAALAALLVAPVASPASEAFYLRAALHGHRLFGELPLSFALRDRAVRLLVARAMPPVLAAISPVDHDPACAQPLALIEAMLRGHGLDAYAHDLLG